MSTHVRHLDERCKSDCLSHAALTLLTLEYFFFKFHLLKQRQNRYKFTVVAEPDCLIRFQPLLSASNVWYRCFPAAQATGTWKPTFTYYGEKCNSCAIPTGSGSAHQHYDCESGFWRCSWIFGNYCRLLVCYEQTVQCCVRNPEPTCDSTGGSPYFLLQRSTGVQETARQDH